MRFSTALVAALVALAGTGGASACQYQLGQEYPDEAAEAAALQKMEPVVSAKQQADAASGEARRFFHAKGNGCARATVKVLGDVDSSLQHGVFAEPNKEFDAVIRFSNGLSDVNPDSTPDTRGFAMQVLGVEGERLLSDDRTSVATFISAAYPSFLFSDATTIASQMEIFSRTGVSGAAAKAAFLAAHPRTALAVAKTLFMGKGVVSPLSATYWSQTPYRLGPSQAVKFKFAPCVGESIPDDGKVGNNYLRENLNLMLNKDSEPACFLLSFQKQEDACEQPVEDSMVEWKTDWWPVATVTVHPDQDLDSPQAQSQCENAEFNPWHNTVDHRPLGINRIRRGIYPFSSGSRHALNGVQVHQW